VSLKSIGTIITSKTGRQILTMQKHSPVILFGAGVAGFMATVVLATRATFKLDEILQQNEKLVSEAETAIKSGSTKYVEDDYQHDLKLAKVQTAIQVVKLYAPAVAIGVASIGCLTGSHVILTKRNAAVTAAYAALDKGFREYRARVVQDAGADKDTEYRYGLVDKEIAVETDSGTDVKTIKAMPNDLGHSIYARCFDEGNRNWKSGPGYNQLFIRSQQDYANDKLRANGHLFLNEVYDLLGMDRTKEGSVVGWVVGNGDGYVDFGIFRSNLERGTEFAIGNERSVWLDFNVDGIIYDKI
jgi:hypothetical protein